MARVTNFLADDLPSGMFVGEYRVERKLAMGGMGAVYAARHPVIDKRAAIKVLHQRFCTSEEIVQRFVDEARAVNQIQHQNIVDVFAFGVLPDQRSYFVMEWLEGQSLFQRMRKERIPLPDIFEILEQLCDALVSAHAKGVVHRDIKPDNVFLVQGRGQPRPFVKLVDFGIAKLAEGTPDPEGLAMGTPEYISPEQARAESVGPPTDVYSLGVMAFELFVGQRPFDGTTPAELLTLHAFRPPPCARDLWPLAPPALDTLLSGMLRKDPKERPSLQSVQYGLRELSAAAALARADRRFGAPLARRSSRPVLVREFDSLATLIRPLISELSSGLAWVKADSEGPAPGTPIIVRFRVPRLSVHVDLPALSGQRGRGEGRTLLRYDYVDRARLDHFFGVAAQGVRLPRSEVAENEAVAVWAGPLTVEPSWIDDPLDVAKASAPDDSEAATLAIDPVIGGGEQPQEPPQTPNDGVPRPVLEGFVPDTVDISEGGSTRTQSIAAPLRLGIGLTTKVLALTVLVAVGAVLASGYFAREQVKEDRKFYEDHLTVSTSRFLMDSLVQRLDRWHDRLSIVAAAGDVVQFDEGDFSALARCSKTKSPQAKGSLTKSSATKDHGDAHVECVSRRGPEPPSEMVERALAAAHRTLEVLSRDGAVDLSTRHGDAVAVASIASEALIDPRFLESGALTAKETSGTARESSRDSAHDSTHDSTHGGAATGSRRSDLIAIVVSDRAGVLWQSHGGTSSFVDQDLIDALSHDGGVVSGSREIVASEGTRLRAAWTAKRGFRVIVLVEEKIAADAIALITYRVASTAGVTFVVAVLVGLALARGLTRRLRLLTRHAALVGQGDFSEIRSIGGRDEVGVLAQTFEDMTIALRSRDEEVLRVHRKMTDDQSKTVQRQVSNWLEAELAPALDEMKSIVNGAPAPSSSLEDGASTVRRLKTLIAQAAGTVEHALTVVAMVGRKVDLAMTVSEALSHARATSTRSDVVVDFLAPNAVMFPQIEARESEIRELVLGLVEACSMGLPSGEHVRVLLTLVEGALVLSFECRDSNDVERHLRDGLNRVRPIVLGHRARVGETTRNGRRAVSFAFPVRGESRGEGADR